MSDITSDNDDLSVTHEHLIAGVVILLFGLLYWFLNNGWNSTQQEYIVEPPPPLVAVKDRKVNRKVDGKVDTQPIKKGYQLTPAVVTTSAATTVVAEEPSVADSSLSVTSKVESPEKTVAGLAEDTIQQKQSDIGTVTTPEDKTTELAENTVKQTEDVPVVADEVANNQNQSASPVITEPMTEPMKEVVPTYSLPDGTVIKISAEGFEGDLQQLFQNSELNKPLTFDQIYFDTGSTKINAKSDRQIKVTAALMNAFPKTNVLLRGHTDNRGSPSANFQLSLARANSMGLALGALGIDTERIRVLGMGDGFPVSSNNTEEGRKKNRRIEILLQ